MSVQQEKFTEIAKAIRDKLGTTELIKPSDFATKVGEVYEKGKAEGGGNDAIQYITNMYRVFEYAVFPENFDLVLSPKYHSQIDINCYNTFRGAKNLKSAKIIHDRPTANATDMQSMFRENSTLETVDLSEFNNLKPSTVAWMFLATPKLKSVYGAFDMSKCTSTTIWLNGATALVDMEFVPNTINITISFEWCQYLSADTIQSIIDGLIPITDGVARTLTLHADVRAKLTPEQVNTIKNEKGWSLIPE